MGVWGSGNKIMADMAGASAAWNKIFNKPKKQPGATYPDQSVLPPAPGTATHPMPRRGGVGGGGGYHSGGGYHGGIGGSTTGNQPPTGNQTPTSPIIPTDPNSQIPTTMTDEQVKKDMELARQYEIMANEILRLVAGLPRSDMSVNLPPPADPVAGYTAKDAANYRNISKTILAGVAGMTPSQAGIGAQYYDGGVILNSRDYLAKALEDSRPLESAEGRTVVRGHDEDCSCKRCKVKNMAAGGVVDDQIQKKYDNAQGSNVDKLQKATKYMEARQGGVGTAKSGKVVKK